MKPLTNKKISKNGQIGIPKQVRKQLNIQNGDFLTIYYDNDVLVIEKWDNQHHNQLNQCIFSNGRVSIPIELRRIHNIELDFPVTMEISNKKILLKQ